MYPYFRQGLLSKLHRGGYPELQTLKEIQAAGAHAYVSKNDASDALLRVVEDLLESKRVASTAVGNSTN